MVRSMPSLLHEGLIELVRGRPAFVADLLERVLEVEVPAFTEARLAETTLHELVPIDHPCVWFQPGAFDAACVQFARGRFRIVMEGDCIMVVARWYA